ncbi:tripartite tricarboxylate transporter substrate-binding protein [Roseiarcaceae bacterium H3SJ34-1]|uniref:Bug family tripartite tricarboxylate transporter substrate binding protein n=1 Tax=Terripilifer ovatus TaxID=3032367 RepID=UPI003AB938EB|nr:tripartite tricarboxylate transporter substrate-binding protein [Roseiarcaceae bacterium H3SJ34-1]
MPVRVPRLPNVTIGLLATIGVASAQEAKIPRNIVIYIAGGAGSGMDIYARILAPHMAKHISPDTVITVQAMPGAGGIRAATFMAQTAPKDGSAMATFPSGPIVEPLVGARKPGYDMSQFHWIGAMSRDVTICVSWADSKFHTLDDARHGEMILAGTGAGSETDTIPLVLNDVLKTRFRVVSGYQTTRDTLMAMERGEVNGRCGISYSSLKAARPDWLLEKKAQILLQIGAEKNSELPEVPLASQIIPKPEDVQALELLTGATSINRPFAVPPGTPAATVAVLRKAFDAAMADPALLKEVRTMDADISPTSGVDVQRIIMKLYATPASIVERTRRLVEARN